MRENRYQAELIKKLEDMFPECHIFKLDGSYKQGQPDIIILWGEKWAALEVKTSITADKQPNQDYYITRLNDMSLAAFIYPDNEQEVLSALQQAFKPSRRARISQS